MILAFGLPSGMILAFGLPNGLAYAFGGLSRMALQPQVPCQADTDQNVVIQTEIDLAGLLRAGPVVERSFEPTSRTAMVANKLECASSCLPSFRIDDI